MSLQDIKNFAKLAWIPWMLLISAGAVSCDRTVGVTPPAPPAAATPAVPADPSRTSRLDIERRPAADAALPRADDYQRAKARARAWFDRLEVDPVALLEAGIKGKKKLAEIL